MGETKSLTSRDSTSTVLVELGPLVEEEGLVSRCRRIESRPSRSLTRRFGGMDPSCSRNVTLTSPFVLKPPRSPEPPAPSLGVYMIPLCNDWSPLSSPLPPVVLVVNGDPRSRGRPMVPGSPSGPVETTDPDARRGGLRRTLLGPRSLPLPPV